MSAEARQGRARAEPQPSRAEPSRARAEPSRAGAGPASPSRAQPSRFEPKSAKPSRDEPSRRWSMRYIFQKHQFLQWIMRFYTIFKNISFYHEFYYFAIKTPLPST